MRTRALGHPKRKAEGEFCPGGFQRDPRGQGGLGGRRSPSLLQAPGTLGCGGLARFQGSGHHLGRRGWQLFPFCPQWGRGRWSSGGLSVQAAGCVRTGVPSVEACRGPQPSLPATRRVAFERRHSSRAGPPTRTEASRAAGGAPVRAGFRASGGRGLARRASGWGRGFGARRRGWGRWRPRGEERGVEGGGGRVRGGSESPDRCPRRPPARSPQSVGPRGASALVSGSAVPRALPGGSERQRAAGAAGSEGPPGRPGAGGEGSRAGGAQWGLRGAAEAPVLGSGRVRRKGGPPLRACRQRPVYRPALHFGPGGRGVRGRGAWMHAPLPRLSVTGSERPAQPAARPAVTHQHRPRGPAGSVLSSAPSRHRRFPRAVCLRSSQPGCVSRV